MTLLGQKSIFKENSMFKALGAKIEVRDSRTGYLVPVRYGLGVWPDWRVVGAPLSPPSPSPSASIGNSIPKYINFDICSEISSSGSSHQIRLVKLVSNFPTRAKVHRKLYPKSIFYMNKLIKSAKFPHFYRLARVLYSSR